MANAIYNNAKEELLKAGINLASDTIKVMLVTSSYTPNVDTHDFKDDITNEVTGTGYTAGGATLASKAVTQDDANDRGAFDAADTTWGSSTITARGAVVYKDTGTPSTSPVICYFDFTTDQISNNGNFTIQWHANGILLLT